MLKKFPLNKNRIPLFKKKKTTEVENVFTNLIGLKNEGDYLRR